MTDPWCWYINANIKGVYWWDPWHTIYSSTMDPMGLISYILSDYYHPISPISPSISTGLPPSPWRPILPRWRRPCKGSSRSESWSRFVHRASWRPRDVRVTRSSGVKLRNFARPLVKRSFWSSKASTWEATPGRSYRNHIGKTHMKTINMYIIYVIHICCFLYIH